MSAIETKDLTQGTEAWRHARVGKITGSIVGQVLGVSPFGSRKAALRRMVQESQGNMDHFTNEAMSWGTDHEDEAARLYVAMYAGTAEVTETGFWTNGDLGASPDRLVGGDGMCEIKAPFGIRNDTSPKFKTIEEVPHYWHQMQMQMYITGRQWCDFLQWTPHDHSLVRVPRDPNWFEANVGAFADFMEDYQGMVEQMSTGGPEERLAASEGFEVAMAIYRSALDTEAAVKAQVASAKQAVIDLMTANKLDTIDSDYGKVTKITSKGSVKWAEVAKQYCSADQIAEAKTKPENIGKASTSWKITLSKDV